jgi:flagellar motor switch protein FliN/FliY
MADPVDYVPFETTTSPAAGAPGSAELERLYDVPVELAVEIGRTHMTIRETLALGPGSIVTLNRLAGEPVDLLVNGKPIARGEVVVLDEEFGLRVTEVLTTGAGAPGSASAPAPEPGVGGTASVPGLAASQPAV